MEKLKELLQANEQKFRETGHMFGKNKLELKESDPIKYELAHPRLLSSLISAREMSKMISSSVVTREMGELSYGLFTPDGNSIAFSTGIMLHISVMGNLIKWMIRNDYEDDPGFHEEDLFSSNDTTIAGVHVPDVYTVTPIYYKGDLIGWAGGVTHVGDVGAALADNGMSHMITERFQEGVHISGEKVGENFKLFRYYEERIRRQTRMAYYWLLDDRARIAGDAYVCNEVKKFIDQVGYDYYRKVTEELIEEGRRHLKARIKEELIPGRYRAAHFYDSLLKGKPVLLPKASKDNLFHVPFELTVTPEAKLIINVEGASPEAKCNLNATRDAVMGMLAIGLVQTLSFDGKANQGSMVDLDLRSTPGSICNSVDQFAACGNSWGTTMSIGESLFKSMSRAFYCRGYIEEIILPGGCHAGCGIGGTNQYGQSSGAMPFEAAASASGARGIMDGIDSAWSIWNPEGDQGNAEMWELVFPFIYLGRRVVPDSGGYGKYRGGVTFKSVWMVWNTMDFLFSGVGYPSTFPLNESMCGGYPFPILGYEIAEDTNMKERILKKLPLPHGSDDPQKSDLAALLKGRNIQLNIDRACVIGPLENYDIVTSPQTGGCGFGDPLDRDPHLVAIDLGNGFISQQSAEKIYGVIASFDDATKKWRVDEEDTKARRQIIRKERIKKGVPVKNWWKAQRQRVKKGELPEGIKQMYAECKGLNPSWWVEHFNKFWAIETKA